MELTIITTQKKDIRAIKLLNLFYMNHRNIQKKTVLFLLLCFCFTNSNSQQNNNNFLLEEGCYSNGYEITPATTNFWYIKKDSSFIWFYTSKNCQIKFIRMGKWHYLGDSVLSLQYYALKSTLLVNSKIDYQAETKGSSDSVYFYGNIKGPNCGLTGHCGLIFDNDKKDYTRYGVSVGYGLRGVTTDVNGNFGFAIHKNLYFGSLGIVSTPDYFPLTITTFPNYNYHTLNITVPLKDSSNDIDINKFDDRPEVYKYRPNPERKKMQANDHDLFINFITKDRTPLLNILYEARKRQPYLVGPIDELIEFLKRE